MFEVYAACVLEEFKKKQINNQLSLNMRHPTAAKLKAESVEVCRSRFLKKDEKVLRSFFEPQSDAAAYCLAIKKSEADLFKPLRNFLKGDTDKTQEKNIELLAWLIDYEQRPYQMGVNYKTSQPGSISETESAEKNTETLPSTAGQPAANTTAGWKKTVLIWSLLSVIGGSVVYLLLKTQTTKNTDEVKLRSPRPLAKNDDLKCMYWADDHFEVADYASRPKSQLAYQIDNDDLAHFKKILQPDTLTNASIGKVWYFKADADSIEYFTADGFHPLYRDRRLKPLTAYMINRYIYNKSNTRRIRQTD